MREDEMVGWHHRLKGHEFEQAPRDGEGQGSLACCSLWGHKESNMTEATQHTKSMWMLTAAMKLKDTCSLEEKL